MKRERGDEARRESSLHVKGKCGGSAAGATPAVRASAVRPCACMHHGWWQRGDRLWMHGCAFGRISRARLNPELLAVRAAPRQPSRLKQARILPGRLCV